MDSLLPAYSVNEPTWFYLSLLLIIAVFFRFTRVWSLRNLDLTLLLAISPGLLLVEQNPAIGYGWLFAGTGIFLIRLFCDGLFKRRPHLTQNLNVPGLTFLGLATFAFLMTKVITEPPAASTVKTVRKAEHLLNLKDVASDAADASDGDVQSGPATTLLATPVVPTSKLVAAGNQSKSGRGDRSFEQIAARLLAVLSHFAVLLGLVVLGHRHFGDSSIGLAMATLYLLLPCTAYDIGRVNHVLPAALIVWAFNAYRMPMVAGSLMGLACGALFFPIFLLPLWVTFYRNRGALRFGMALCLVAAVLLGSLVLTSADTHSFTKQILGSIDWSALKFHGSETEGFWSTHSAVYRIPVVVAFVVMLAVLTFWPWRKNLEHLMAHSTAIVVGTQLWYPQQGGVYLLWYLPLLLMVVFRPRMAHAVPPMESTQFTTKREEPNSGTSGMSLTASASSRLFR